MAKMNFSRFVRISPLPMKFLPKWKEFLPEKGARDAKKE
jgi:hypothetical protein